MLITVVQKRILYSFIQHWVHTGRVSGLQNVLPKVALCQTVHHWWVFFFFKFDEECRGECLPPQKSLRILVHPFPLSTGHPPHHQRLHLQVMGDLPLLQQIQISNTNMSRNNIINPIWECQNWTHIIPSSFLPAGVHSKKSKLQNHLEQLCYSVEVLSALQHRHWAGQSHWGEKWDKEYLRMFFNVEQWWNFSIDLTGMLVLSS